MKNLNEKDFAALLAKLGACKEVKTWAEGKSLAEVWATCPRGEWLLWLTARYGDVPRKTIVAIACDCTESALAFTTGPRPAECLAVVRRWLKDEATLEEVRAAAGVADATYAAAYAADAAYAAAGVANAAAYADAADAAAAYAAAAYAAANAAWAYAANVANAAAYAANVVNPAKARADSLRFSADICRKYIQVED